MQLAAGCRLLRLKEAIHAEGMFFLKNLNANSHLIP